MKDDGWMNRMKNDRTEAKNEGREQIYSIVEGVKNSFLLPPPSTLTFADIDNNYMF